MAKKLLRIAIDGPGGAGKSTVAKAIALRFGIDYVDTGAMYRAVALKMIRNGIKAEASSELNEMLDSTVIDFSSGRIILDSEDVSEFIRTQEVSMMASDSSKLLPVREKLVALQKSMGKSKSLVMDGRDIGTNVMPEAEFKFYVTAAPEERAKRRYTELIAKGQQTDYNTILKEINERDYNDMHRALNPLKKADDALEIDTTFLGIDEVVEKISTLMSV